MALGTQKRTRLERVAALEMPPSLLERTWDCLQKPDVLLRLGLGLLTALVLWAITSAWAPSLPYRTGFTPRRNVVARVEFQKFNKAATDSARESALRRVRSVYEQDKEPLVQLRAALHNRVVQVTGVNSLEELPPGIWEEFFAEPAPGAPALTPEERAQHFKLFHDALPDQEAITKFEKAMVAAMEPFEQYGLMKEPPQEVGDGNTREIVVQHKGKSEWQQKVQVSDVLIGRAEALKKRLDEKLESPEVAARVFDWLRPRLTTTLTYKHEDTQQAKDQAVRLVADQYINYQPGDVIAKANEPLTLDTLSLLELEHEQLLEQFTLSQRLYYSLATMGMFIALSTLCAVYVLCYERKLLLDLRRFVTLLGLVIITVGSAILASGDAWRMEVVPLLLFGMTLSIAYHQELALLFSAAVALIVVVAIGQGLSEFIILAAAAATAVLLVGRIRSRKKLIYVGLAVGLVTLLTTIGVKTLEEQPFWPTIWPDAVRFGLGGIIAGFAITGLLPFIENLFSVQTELSLLELGDVAHPLLQELVRRAPGTYNHSINVASIAEAAAESIGANGLLVRVGAYFHDIGKMLKPSYFVENQGHDGNRHESLVPAMSTLIIIAHIKDGADLARQHHLPEPIIDFIQQHHGTTLVEYFYRRASEQSEANPDAGVVEESNFRYPGPKPQTKEAGVLMLADAVESASRALVDPTPSRIENLVHEIAMKRLLDGQFDCCGLTLQELATIEDSLVKSLTAVYHCRVKYPDQRTA